MMTHQCKGHFSCACGNPLWKTLVPKGVNLLSSSSKSIKADNQSIAGDTQRDMIFHAINGGTIQTLAGGENKTVEAIGIKDGKIVATGSLKDVQKAWHDPASPAPTLIQGTQFLQPAFIEPHVHIIPSAVINTGVDISPFIGQYLRGTRYTQDWVVDQLKAAAQQISGVELPPYALPETTYPENPPEPMDLVQSWVLGHNVDPSLLHGENKSFDATVLDNACNNRPIMVTNTSGHLAYINTFTIKQIDSYNEQNNGEEDFVPVSSGDNGILQEFEQIMSVMVFLSKWFGRPNDAQIKEQVDKVFSNASACGVTYMLDALLDDQQVELLSKYAHNKDSLVRIAGAYGVDSLKQLNNDVIGTYQPNQGDENFNLAYLKLISDGSAQGLTAYQYTPYDCDENYNEFGMADNSEQTITANDIAKQNNTGLFNFGYPIEFNAIVQQANMSRWPLMIHANGDHAIARTINAFSTAGMSESTIDQRRDRIEHCSLLTSENMFDMQQLGISPSFTIGHVGYWGWGFQNTIIGEQRANQLDLCRTTVTDYDMRITLHSDYSVTPLGPLRMMEQSITRLMEGTAEGLTQKVLNPLECLTPFQALKAMTYDAAWQCHADKWVGSLEVGKCADFAILAESPLTYQNKENLAHPALGMRNIPVLETWKGGKKVHTASPDFVISSVSNIRYHADSQVLTFNYLAPYIKGNDSSIRNHINAAFRVCLQVEGESSSIQLQGTPIRRSIDTVSHSLNIENLVSQIPKNKAYTLTLEAGPDLNETSAAVYAGFHAIAASSCFTLHNTADINPHSTVITAFSFDDKRAKLEFKLPPSQSDISSDSWVVIIDPSIDADGKPTEQATFGWGKGDVDPNGKNVVAYHKLTAADQIADGSYRVSSFVKLENGAPLKSGNSYRAGVCLIDTYQLCAYKDAVYVESSQKDVNPTVRQDEEVIQVPVSNESKQPILEKP